MKTSIFEWLWTHKPDVAIILVLIIVAIWLTVKINDFLHRFMKTEGICVDIQVRQLPELRREMDEKFKAVDRKFEKVDQRLDRIEIDIVSIKMFMKKIDTYFAATHKDYPKEYSH